MSDLEPHISRINTKLQQLLKQYLLLEKEKEQLLLRLNKKEEQETILSEKIVELQQQVGLLKAVTGQMNSGDKLALEKNINKHLKEIDRCITFLSE